MRNYELNYHLRLSTIDPIHIVEQFDRENFIYAIIDQGNTATISDGYRFVIVTFRKETLSFHEIKNVFFRMDSSLTFMERYKPKHVILFEDQ